MYLDFFGLSELPFELTANPKYLFLTKGQREALSIVQYGLLSSRSLTLLLGEAGTGKTTLIKAALESERCRHIRCIHLGNPPRTGDDFIRLLALKFDLGHEAGASKSLLIDRLETLLRERQARGEITALVIDEAQTLTFEPLEEIRLLANIETTTTKLLPLVLAGQPELGMRLEDPALRQLKQRVTLRARLEPFDMNGTAAYMASRIATAGGVAANMFSRDAVAAIHQHSGGIARTINVICDNALVNAMALRRRMVDRAMVLDICRELSLSAVVSTVPRAGGSRPEPAAPRPHEPTPLSETTTPGGDDEVTPVAAPHRSYAQATASEPRAVDPAPVAPLGRLITR